MPAMVGIVQRRLAKWKRLQPNSSANEAPQGRARQGPPKAKDGSLSQQGQARPAPGHSDGSVNGQIARQALDELSKEMAGISGEHIADYICAYGFHWGTDWKGHDDGSKGRWTEGTPSATKTGKLSHGGSPKSAHVLYRLSDGANGVGIDAVWRAAGRNGGKPYAIVEAKATRNEDGPKFLRKPNNTRKPSITSTLGENAIRDPSELLEPLEEDEAASASKPTSTNGKGGRRRRGDAGAPARSGDSKQAPATQPVRDVLVQMSREWIGKNLPMAVGHLADEIRQSEYSRHLFFCPAYHPSGSPAAHMKAKLVNLPPAEHASHDAFHYDDAEIRRAVNKRKATLRKQHGNLPSLKDER